MTNSFADDPAAFFANNAHAAHQLAQAEREAMQLTALQARFEMMRDRLPPLKALADAARIDEIRSLEDALPLLFPASFYKAYDETRLDNRDFAWMTEWLGRFTLNDLSAVAHGNFESLDAWLSAIDAQTDVDMFHSSGTMGRLSFYPRGNVELEQQKRIARFAKAEAVEPMDYDYQSLDFALIWPAAAGGWSAGAKAPGVFRASYCAHEADFYALSTHWFSSDVQLFGVRRDRARKRGSALPKIDGYTIAKMEEAERMLLQFSEMSEALLNRIRNEVQGRQAIMMGGPLGIHKFATEGLNRGMEGLFGPGSTVLHFGGLKGVPAAPTLDEDIKRFTGATKTLSFYGMTELNDAFGICRNDRYHIRPWIIPFILDLKTGCALPREGTQRGRAAFMDLVAQTYWGGLVSSDLIEINWERCACGRNSPHLDPNIERIPPPEDEDDHAVGPASPESVHRALKAILT